MGYDTFIGYAKDVAALAPLVTAGCAIWALKAWKRQLRKQHDHALAKKVILSAHAVREEIVNILVMRNGTAESLQNALQQILKQAAEHQADLVECNAMWDWLMSKHNGIVLYLMEELKGCVVPSIPQVDVMKLVKVIEKATDYTTAIEETVSSKLKI